MKHTITALVENKPGMLARIVGLITGRGYNIETLCVAPTQEDEWSKLTVVVLGESHVLEQICLQLRKLVGMQNVTDVTRRRHLSREMILAEIAADEAGRASIEELAARFNAAIVAVHEQSLTLRMIGNDQQIAEFLQVLRGLTLLDISRSGVLAVARGNGGEQNAHA